MEHGNQRNWTKQYKWLNETNSNYLDNRDFQKSKETTFIINTSSAKLKIQFSSSPELNNHPTLSERVSLLILKNTVLPTTYKTTTANTTVIYNIFNNSGNFYLNFSKL